MTPGKLLEYRSKLWSLTFAVSKGSVVTSATTAAVAESRRDDQRDRSSGGCDMSRLQRNITLHYMITLSVPDDVQMSDVIMEAVLGRWAVSWDAFVRCVPRFGGCVTDLIWRWSDLLAWRPDQGLGPRDTTLFWCHIPTVEATVPKLRVLLLWGNDRRVDIYMPPESTASGHGMRWTCDEAFLPCRTWSALLVVARLWPILQQGLWHG